MRLTPMEQALLESLRAAAESWTDEANKMASVYLDNARGDETPRQFAGLLSSLHKKGFYNPESDEAECYFGEVKMDNRWEDLP